MKCLELVVVSPFWSRTCCPKRIGINNLRAHIIRRASRTIRPGDHFEVENAGEIVRPIMGHYSTTRRAEQSTGRAAADVVVHASKADHHAATISYYLSYKGHDLRAWCIPSGVGPALLVVLKGFIPRLVIVCAQDDTISINLSRTTRGTAMGCKQIAPRMFCVHCKRSTTL